MILNNSAGGKTLRIGRFSIFTDPCFSKFEPMLIKDNYHIALYLGYINFNFEFNGW